MFCNKIISLFLAIAVLFTFTGCETEKNDNEIVMWLVGSEAQAMAIMDLSKEYTEKTGISVRCQAISWSTAHSKYLTSIAGGVAPDIGTMGLTWGMEFGELGAMIDLKKLFPEDLAELEKNNFPGLVRSTKLGEKVYVVPLDMSEQIMYYRTDLVEKVPETWDDLISTLKKLKTQNKGMVIDWGSFDWIGFSPFLWQAGGDYFNKDLTKVTLDSPAAVKALTFFAQLYKEGVPKSLVPLEQGMRTGDYPIAMSGNWKIISLSLGAPEIKGKWAIALLPKGPSGKRTAFVGGRIMGIFESSEKKKESWEFIKFLSRPDIQAKLYRNSLETEDSYLPPNMDSWTQIEMDPKIKKVLNVQAKDTMGPPPIFGWNAVTKYINHAIQMVILKNADPMKELKIASDKMRKELGME
ncbi:MAG: extracellular solute-binding protein [Candidatus Omnitrophica bacterium]|nr:extracellular solute-binding protein [Candidatus Omnitrophota bacterium]